MAAEDVPPLAPAAATRERRTDPVTGLPIFRYRFVGAPTLQPGDPAPDGAWRVLRVERRADGTILDLETQSGAEALAAPAIDDAVAAAALTTLQDARELGVAHGDLGPHRLFRRGDGVWIEGYGIPWRSDATVEGDAHDLAAGLLALDGTRLGASMRARLAGLLAVATVDADADVDADVPIAAPTPPAAVESFEAPNRDDVASADAAKPNAQAAQPPVPAAPVAPPAAAPAQRTARPQTPPTRTSSAGRRQVVLAVALALAATTWGLLAAWSQQRPVAPTFVVRTVGHVVDVRVDPAGRPPVSLLVVESPTGSRLAPGSLVGSVPSKVLLDLAGVWRFEARFGDRRSQVVALVVPSDPYLNMPFPTLPQNAAP